MQAQIKDIRKKFLDEFTLEIILNLLQIRIDIIKQKEEEERVRRVVEAEKLKLKFKQYAEEKEKQKKQLENPEEIHQVTPIQPKQIIPQTQKIQPQIPFKPTNVFHKELEIQQTKPQVIQQAIQPPRQAQRPQQMPQKAEQMNLGENKSALDKILMMLNNTQITHIECPSENANVIIKRMGHAIKTDIILKKEELISIVKYYSEKARIPLIEGMLIARVDNLEISAVVSESSRSSFIIKKIITPPVFPRPL